jgi:two-component system response regulator FixJ
MAGMSGLELQGALTARSVDLPIILLTGHGDVQMAVHAMKAGAFDFIEKPFNNQQLLELVQQAINSHVQSRSGQARREKIDALFHRLTPREREVLDRVVAG